PDTSLRPGMFARVRLITRDARAALVLPERARVPQGDQQFVYRVIDGKAVRSKVEVGQRRDSMVEMLNGVTKDDVVVTAGQLKIRDGAMVTFAGNDAAKGAATAATPAAQPPAAPAADADATGGSAVIAPAEAS